MQLPILVGLRRSRILDLLIGLNALLVCVAILAFPAFGSMRFAALVVVLGLCILVWKRLVPPFVALRLERDGTISAKVSNRDDFTTVALQPDLFVHPYLTTVRLIPEDGRGYWLILTVDSTNRADFRKLRIFLRWRAIARLKKGDV